MPIADCGLPIAWSIDGCRFECRLMMAGVGRQPNRQSSSARQSSIVKQSTIGGRLCNRQTAIAIRQ
jgi:hypothetical protein